MRKKEEVDQLSVQAIAGTHVVLLGMNLPQTKGQGLLGFAINIATGALFVLTEPDQYIYNPSFHFKLLFLAVAGLNAGIFYLTSYRQAFGPAAQLDAPMRAKVIAAISLSAAASWEGSSRPITPPVSRCSSRSASRRSADSPRAR